MNTYFISGLGADKRIFSKLKLNEKINIIHIDWIDPKQNETLAAYAARLGGIIDTSQPFALVGVSFGGMIAVEVAKILAPIVTVIISSTMISSQLPGLYRFAGKLGLLKFIPAKLLKSSNKLTQNYYFGTRSGSEKVLLSKIIKDTDPYFLKWAIGSILSWKNETRPERMYHIHGTHDKILYSKTAQPDFVIENGTHFMVYQNAVEISGIINQIILNTSKHHADQKDI
ncbi:alpha/beta hydrolase [Pedobacter sp. HDW13]|uniref:alpha/beta hydrolase n=1 Tax=unclassified Pedobacter TaxID=2628915 RepID=UPI000F5AC9A4|nr:MULTISPECIES: alpha/beta hydrolase [unclassified Pedobacter]QIL42466.1 alpha/beta hydrolase [Pedobacter sp. HDW13]RQO78946.1 alpha/beta hydrolase [Pedobacter sp. KBW01]